MNVSKDRMQSTPPSDPQPLPHYGAGAGTSAGTMDTMKVNASSTGTKPAARAMVGVSTSAGTGAGTVLSSPEAVSAYSSWSVPSLENLFSSRRASAFGLRYGLGSPQVTVASSGAGRVSPSPSGISFMMEGGTTGSSMQNKSRKMSIRMSDSITSVLNDVSLVLYRVNEHIHKKVPILVQEKKALSTIGADVERANQDMEDARLTLTSLRRISELGAIEDLVKRALVAAQK